MKVLDMAERLTLAGFDPWSMTLHQCVAAMEVVQARDRAALLVAFRAQQQAYTDAEKAQIRVDLRAANEAAIDARAALETGLHPRVAAVSGEVSP